MNNIEQPEPIEITEEWMVGLESEVKTIVDRARQQWIDERHQSQLENQIRKDPTS